MAAVVANHYEVAQLLLAVRPQASRDLARAINRYGQSALHIASRKGSVQLLNLLLTAQGIASLSMPDSLGETPMDIAKKHSHLAAIAEFEAHLAQRA